MRRVCSRAGMRDSRPLPAAQRFAPQSVLAHVQRQAIEAGRAVRELRAMIRPRGRLTVLSVGAFVA
jgi:hypothetical protein